jgi:hypothetical protein
MTTYATKHSNTQLLSLILTLYKKERCWEREHVWYTTLLLPCVDYSRMATRIFLVYCAHKILVSHASTSLKTQDKGSMRSTILQPVGTISGITCACRLASFTEGSNIHLLLLFKTKLANYVPNMLAILTT